MTTTVIRNADWVIAWDEAAGQHAYRRDVDLAFADDRIVFVGRNYAGTADRVIDGSNRLVMPGLINIHSHPEHEPLYRGIREEHGRAEHAHDRALRALAGVVGAGRRGARGQRRIRLLRAAC